MAITQAEFFDEEFQRAFPEAGSNLAEGIQSAFPAPQGLTPDEQEELARLTGRSARLQPLESPGRQRSTRIGRNPFSFDVSPAVNAVQEGITRLVNAERERRLLGDAEEFQDATTEAENLEGQASALRRSGTANVSDGLALQFASGAEGAEERADQLEGRAGEARGRARRVEPVAQRLQRLEGIQEQAAEGRETQSEILQEMFPDVAARMSDVAADREAREADQENELALIRERTRQDIREWQETVGSEEGRAGEGSDRDPSEAVGVVTGFIGQVDPYVSSLTSTIQGLEEQKVAFPDRADELDNRIENLQSERSELQRWQSDAYRALAEGNLYDPQLIERFNAITGAAQTDDGQEFNFIEDMMQRAQEGGFDFENPLSEQNASGGQIQTGAFD